MIYRKEGENGISFIKRVTEMKNMHSIDYTEWGQSILGSKIYSSDNCRKGFYFVDKIIELYFNGDEIEDVEIRKELTQLKDEIYKEKVKLQDQRREYNKKLREEARFEHLCDVLKEQMDLVSRLEFNPHVYECDEDIQAHLAFSDLHYGLKIDNVLNFYSTEVAKNRVEELTAKTIKYCAINKVKVLNVTLLGDLINGIINVSNRVEQDEDVITQITDSAELISNMIIKLKESIPEIKLRGVIGNHSRLYQDKKKSINRENFERLIFAYITLRTGVQIIQNGTEDFATFKIKNKLIAISHGDKDNINNAKMNFVNLLGVIPDEIWVGHFHSSQSKDDNDTEIVVNGSIISTDNYAVSIRKNTKPSQTLRIYGDDILTYKIGMK